MFSLEETLEQHFEVVDDPLTNGKIRAVAQQMKTGKAPGPNRFCGDTVQHWALAEEGTMDAACFDKLGRALPKDLFDR